MEQQSWFGVSAHHKPPNRNFKFNGGNNCYFYSLKERVVCRAMHWNMVIQTEMCLTNTTSSLVFWNEFIKPSWAELNCIKDVLGKLNLLYFKLNKMQQAQYLKKCTQPKEKYTEVEKAQLHHFCSYPNICKFKPTDKAIHFFRRISSVFVFGLKTIFLLFLYFTRQVKLPLEVLFFRVDSIQSGQAKIHCNLSFLCHLITPFIVKVFMVFISD